MPELPKTFKHDHLIRDASGKPLGRVVLAEDYEMGANIAVALMEVPGSNKKAVKGQIFYIDGFEYRVPDDVPDIRFTNSPGKLIVNNFYLKKVK